MLILRSAINYDPNFEGFEIKDSETGQQGAFHMSSIRDNFGEDLYQNHMKFINQFNTAAEWHKPTMILTMIINLFSSDREKLQNPAMVSVAEEHYTMLLESYLKSRYSTRQATAIQSKLFDTLTNVRDYGLQSRKAIERMGVPQSGDLEPLLREMLE